MFRDFDISCQQLYAQDITRVYHEMRAHCEQLLAFSRSHSVHEVVVERALKYLLHPRERVLACDEVGTVGVVVPRLG